MGKIGAAGTGWRLVQGFRFVQIVRLRRVSPDRPDEGYESVRRGTRITLVLSDLPRRPHGARQHAVGLFVPYNLLLLRIPLQVAAQTQADVSQVRNADGPVRRLDGRDRLFTRDHAVNEIAEVIVALIQMYLIGADDAVDD